MITKTINLYSFDELSEESKEKAIESLSDINVNYPDWDNSIEDAKQIGLQIIALDTHRTNEGNFITNAEDCAKAKECDTYKTAKSFLDVYNPLKNKWDNEPENEGYPFENEHKASELANDFLHSLLEDYRIMSAKEYEYQTSEEQIIEAIKANEYTFTQDGKLENA